MTKLNEEERLAAIEAVEAGESIEQVAKLYQIHESVLMTNVKRYREYGEEGFHTHAYNWTAEQKYQVLKYKQENQLSLRETGIKFRVSISTIYQWEKRYLEKGIKGLKNKKKGRKSRTPKPKPPKTREEELLDRIQDLEMENEYLKKLDALVAEREKRERGNE